MQNSKLNLRDLPPAHADETPIQLSERYGIPLSPAYRNAASFCLYLPISCLPCGVSGTPER